MDALAAIDLLPTELAKACVQVLDLDGAGLSAISDRFRVPLGASDDDATAAERLQFTVGEGPCMQALRDRTEIRVSADDIARRWPAFYDELIVQTPYRSIASLPLQITAEIAGAIDLYFRHPTGAFSVDLRAAVETADHVTEVLRATATPAAPSPHKPGDLLPAWMYSPSATSRLRTWIAAGVLMAQHGLNGPDAMTRIRAYAYAHQIDIADVTDRIIDGSLKL
jgi:hypothetical protein